MAPRVRITVSATPFALLLALLLIPVPFLFAFNGVAYGISQPVSLLLFGIVGTGILIAGRPAR